MNEEEIAFVLYDLCSDMDFMDYAEEADTERSVLAKEIRELKGKDNPLYFVLEIIAERAVNGGEKND